MSARKAACGTMASKVGGEVANQGHPTSYTVLRPLIGHSEPSTGTGGSPDPKIMARVIILLRQLKGVSAAKCALGVSDPRRAALARRMDMLMADLRVELDRDVTGTIRAGLMRKLARDAAGGADHGE